MADATLQCWNCRQYKKPALFLPVPIALKVGTLCLMLALTQMPFYPRNTCGECHTKTTFMGLVGLILAGVIAAICIAVWI